MSIFPNNCDSCRVRRVLLSSLDHIVSEEFNNEHWRLQEAHTTFIDCFRDLFQSIKHNINKCHFCNSFIELLDSSEVRCSECPERIVFKILLTTYEAEFASLNLFIQCLKEFINPNRLIFSDCCDTCYRWAHLFHL